PGARAVEALERARDRALAAARGVGVEPQDGELRVAERLRQLRLDPLRAGAVARDRGGSARPAARRDTLAMAAVVARERALALVQHERDVALRAAPDVPARAAGEEVRPAAAVHEHDRLA